MSKIIALIIITVTFVVLTILGYLATLPDLSKEKLKDKLGILLFFPVVLAGFIAVGIWDKI